MSAVKKPVLRFQYLNAHLRCPCTSECSEFISHVVSMILNIPVVVCVYIFSFKDLSLYY